MMSFARRRRDPNAPSDWLTDADVAARLGIDRTTVWRWRDDGLIPEPVRVGVVQIEAGRTRSRATRWLRADIDLFVQCTNMTEFHRRKRDKEQRR